MPYIYVHGIVCRKTRWGMEESGFVSPSPSDRVVFPVRDESRSSFDEMHRIVIKYIRKKEPGDAIESSAVRITEMSPPAIREEKIFSTAACSFSYLCKERALLPYWLLYGCCRPWFRGGNGGRNCGR